MKMDLIPTTIAAAILAVGLSGTAAAGMTRSHYSEPYTGNGVQCSSHSRESSTVNGQQMHRFVNNKVPYLNPNYNDMD